MEVWGASCHFSSVLARMLSEQQGAGWMEISLLKPSAGGPWEDGGPGGEIREDCGLEKQTSVACGAKRLKFFPTALNV